MSLCAPQAGWGSNDKDQLPEDLSGNDHKSSSSLSHDNQNPSDNDSLTNGQSDEDDRSGGTFLREEFDFDSYDSDDPTPQQMQCLAFQERSYRQYGNDVFEGDASCGGETQEAWLDSLCS